MCASWVEGPGWQTVPQIPFSGPLGILNIAEVCSCQGKSWCRGEPVLEFLQKVSLLVLFFIRKA